MLAVRFPISVLSRGKRTCFLFSDLAYRPVLSCRWFLTDEWAIAVPRNIICPGPAVAAAHPLAVLYGHRGDNIVEKAAGRPSVMRFARRVVLGRLAE